MTAFAIIFAGVIIFYGLNDLAHSVGRIAYELSEIARKLK